MVAHCTMNIEALSIKLHYNKNWDKNRSSRLACLIMFLMHFTLFPPGPSNTVDRSLLVVKVKPFCVCYLPVPVHRRNATSEVIKIIQKLGIVCA